MSAAEYAALLAQQTTDFNAGRASGRRDGATFSPPSISFVTKSVAFEDGYYSGFREARESLLSNRRYEEVS